jgi:hypothetical protein
MSWPWEVTLVVFVVFVVFFGLGGLLFLYAEAPSLWRWWFPDHPFDLTVKRWLRYLGQAFTVGLAYVQVRVSINLLTGVDPGNFPTALAALTALLAVPCWLLVVAFLGPSMSLVYLGRAFFADRRYELGYLLRAVGALVVAGMSLSVLILALTQPLALRVVRIVATAVLVQTEFSYDRTCAVSRQDRWIAHLKGDMTSRENLVSIADIRVLHDITFTTGTCDQDSPTIRG